MFQGATPSEGRAAGGHYIDDVTRSFALLLLAAAPATAEPCKPHAQLEGDAAAVASVTAELVKLGVVVGQSGGDGAPAGCKTVFAAVELGRDGGLAIAVKTGTQSEGRTVSDAVVAASWIDSWVADDFAPPQPAPNGFFDLRAAQTHPDLDADTRTWSDVKIYPWLGISVMAAVDQSWSFDHTRWSGIGGGACAQVSSWCFGARARYATQDILIGQTAAARSDLAILATASYAKQVGRTQLIPELGLGAGKLTTSRIDGCRHVSCDPHDTGCTEPPLEIGVRRARSRACLRTRSRRPVSRLVGDAARSGDASSRLRDHRSHLPRRHRGGHARAIRALGTVQVARRRAPPPGIAPEELALPGESIGTFELGLGLRWGSR